MDSPFLARKTWARTVEPVTKLGYMDGASAGQNSVYQHSFDLGYKEGIDFGFYIGLNEATRSMKQQRTIISSNLLDPRRINCQICLNEMNSQQENVGNLYNIQKEKNLEFLNCSRK